MKKRKIPITKEFASCDKRIMQQLATNMIEQDSIDSRCEKFPACIVCNRAGYIKRTAYVNIGTGDDIRNLGSTFALAICNQCKAKLILDDDARIKQISDIRDLRK